MVNKNIWPNELDKYDLATRKAIEKKKISIAEVAGNFSRSDKKVQDIQRISELNACEESIIEEIIVKELGIEHLPKSRRAKWSEKSEAVQKKQKSSKKKTPQQLKEAIPVGQAVMGAVVSYMDAIENAISEVSKEKSQLQKRYDELEDEYKQCIDFMETHFVPCLEEREKELGELKTDGENQ